MPETERDCCNSEDINVIFIGCTQNGKSSLIKTILRYGGLEGDADEVEIGSFGNRSKTKECRVFPAVVEIHNHYLKNEDGEERIIRPGDQEPEDLDELEPETTSSGRHVHLQLIDTPGLNDSDNNAAEEARTRGRNNTQSAIRTVDEEHKFKIFRLLASISKIHVICFVMSISETLGGANQKLIQEYLRLFKACGLYLPPCFVYTKVNQDTIFEDKVRNHPRELTRHFGLPGGRTRHFFVNNAPDETSPIAKHFTAREVSELLKYFLSVSPCDVGKLRYPKTSTDYPWDQWDAQLHNCFEFLVLELKNQIHNADKEIDLLNKSKVIPEKEKSTREVILKGIKDRYESSSWLDMVEIGRSYQATGWKLWARSEINFYLDSINNVPIRDYKTEQSSKAYWPTIPSKSDIQGRTCISAVLRSTENTESISGTIILYGHRKEKEKQRYEELAGEMRQAEQDLQETRSRFEEIENKAITIKKLKEVVTERLAKVRGEQQTWKTDYLLMTTIEEFGQYFSRPSLVAYAYSLGLGTRLEMKLLSEIDSKVLTTKLRYFKEMQRNATRQIQFWQAMMKTWISRKEKVDNCLNKINEEIKTLEIAIAGLEKRGAINSPGSWEPPKTWENRLALASPDGWILKKEIEMFQEGMDAGKMLMSLSIQSNAMTKQDLVLVLSEVKLQMESHVQLLEDIHKKWTDNLLDAKATRVAALIVQRLIHCEDIPISAFAVLKRGLEFPQGTEDSPWLNLFYEIKDVYWCDPKAFGAFSKSFLNSSSWEEEGF